MIENFLYFLLSLKILPGTSGLLSRLRETPWPANFSYEVVGIELVVLSVSLSSKDQKIFNQRMREEGAQS
jgi:hypothetical protein